MAGNGVKTTDFDPASIVDELLGNVTEDGIMDTVRIPVAVLASLLAESAGAIVAMKVKATRDQLEAILGTMEEGDVGLVMFDEDEAKRGQYAKEGGELKRKDDLTERQADAAAALAKLYRDEALAVAPSFWEDILEQTVEARTDAGEEADRSLDGAGRAEVAAVLAQAASDTAAHEAKIYSSVAAALADAGLPVNGQFQILANPETAVRYRKDSTVVSTQLGSFPTKRAVENIQQLSPLLGNWRELTVDVSGRPVWGKDRNGDEWEARAGALVKIAPRLGMDANNIHTSVANLKITTSFIPPASSGLAVLYPKVGSWRELTVDLLGRPVFGVADDGRRYKAQNGFLIEEQSPSAPVGNQAFDWDGVSFSHLLDAADAVTGNVDLLILIIGQSWAGGYSHDAGDATVTTTAQHPGRALMLSAGVEPDGVASASYVDLREIATSGKFESPASGMADVIMQGLQTRFGRKPRIIFGISAEGGKLYHELKRGSSYYAETLRMVQECVAISAAQGRKLIVPTIALIHGENDASPGNTPISVYGHDLDQWQEHYEEDIRRLTGQTAPVRMYLSQTSYRANVNIGRRMTTALAQLETHKRHPRIRLAGPQYQSPGDDGGGHLKAVGYRMTGAMVGQAILDDYFGVNAEPLYVREAWWATTTSLRLQYSKPIAVETTDALVTVSTLGPGKGIDFTDGSVTPPTVTNIAVNATDNTILDVTLSAAPAGLRPRLHIAARSTPPTGATGYSGATYGNRSGIRSAAPYFNDALTGRTYYHWSCQDEIALPKVS